MKRLAIGAVACAIAIQAGTALAQPALHGPMSARGAKKAQPSGQPVIDWNRALLSIVRTPGAQPGTIQPTRNFAILHAAIYDAVTSIDRSHDPYLIFVRAPRGASETAAADAAAHAVLVGLYPAQQSALDGDYTTELATVPNDSAKVEGIRVGELVARDLLAVRAADGSGIAPPAFVAGSNPGNYQPTPPNFPAPVFTTWGQVTPFVLASGDQFRPPPPPALTSDEYAAAINEVQSLGSATSTTRTADQTVVAKFWAAPIQNYWNEIAQTVATVHHSDLADTARLFAALNLSVADSVIAFYDAKYTYQLWRPITAIRLADTDGNPQTNADPNWTPLATTPADPSYPGAHSTITAAAADTLASFYGDKQRFSVTSEVLPGVTRSFTSFSAVVQEAGLSRIYAGVHTRLDHVAGENLGDDVAGFVLHNALLPAQASHGG
jgi:membrane-associated phospholipid phosphatase